MRHLEKDGETHFVILLPAGDTQLIPAHWTRPVPATAALLWSAASLRMLVRLVATLRQQAAQEALHAHTDPARALADL